MNKMIAIAACPFCGSGEQEHQMWSKNYPGINASTFMAIACDNCGARGPSADDEDSAVRAWNERATDLSVAVPATEHDKVKRLLKLAISELACFLNTQTILTDKLEHEHEKAGVFVRVISPLWETLKQLRSGEEMPVTLCAECGTAILMDEPYQHLGEVDFCAAHAHPGGTGVQASYSAADCERDVHKVTMWIDEYRTRD